MEKGNNKVPEKDIEKVIDKRILEAKLDIAERRLGFYKWLFGVLFVLIGIVYPIWQTNTNTDKVDKAIQEMEEKFDKLAGKHIGKPELKLYYEGKDLGNNLIVYEFVASSVGPVWIEFRNKGNSTAKIKRILLYVNYENERIEDLREDRGSIGDFGITNLRDEPKYNLAFEYWGLDNLELNPEEAYPLNFRFPSFRDMEPIESDALLKVYYGQPEPLRVNFYLEEKRTKKGKK